MYGVGGQENTFAINFFPIMTERRNWWRREKERYEMVVQSHA